VRLGDERDRVVLQVHGRPEAGQDAVDLDAQLDVEGQSADVAVCAAIGVAASNRSAAWHAWLSPALAGSPSGAGRGRGARLTQREERDARMRTAVAGA